VRPVTVNQASRAYVTTVRPPGLPVKAKMIAHQRAPTTAVPPDRPHEATSATGHGGVDAGANDDGEQELVVVRG
jgi:hypothetical protein